ncbi:uncharacterized protein [Watersipora subatra]|uniref:uncharacterized protein n=1 Tax=Watersipora subatra TaxID=2589382 RepID=UPI00355B8DAB
MASFTIWFCLISLSQLISAKRPPFVVLDSEFNELEDLRVFLGDSFRTDAVGTMTARVEENSSPLSGTCESNEPIAVEGSMNCLLAFWRFSNTSPAGLSYDDWLRADRPECDYTIGNAECLTGGALADQLIRRNPTAAVDSNENTVWAHSIIPGVDTTIKISLHGQYQVVALSLDVESVPLDFTIGLISQRGPVRNLVRLQNTPCDVTADPICQEFVTMDRKVLTVSWGLEASPEFEADELAITFHGVTGAGAYMTNYYLIREIKLLAQPVNVMTTPAMDPIQPSAGFTSTQPPYWGKGKSLRQILEEFGPMFESPAAHT